MTSLQRLFMGVLGIVFLMAFQSCGSDDDSSTPANNFTDARDGTVYQTVTIGNKVWMAENLKYLPGVIGPEVESTTTPYYYVYNYDGNNVSAAKALNNYDVYGVLYNWAAAMSGDASSETNPSGVQGVCPDGWHLPSNTEWLELFEYLGGIDVAGGKLKEVGTNHWALPNTGATDEVGFTALPAGARALNGTFGSLSEISGWWGATQTSETNATFYRVFYDFDDLLITSNSKVLGFSVRCVKD